LTLASIGILAILLSTTRTPAKTVKPAELQGAAILWREPTNIRERNLFYGPGGKEHEPKAPYRFQKEDPKGTNPKFDVVDANGVRWGVKLGPEAQPETASSRLVWAAGYFAHEIYFLPEMKVEGMQRLRRGGDLVSEDG